MVKNVFKLLFAVVCIFWIIGFAVVPNPRFCIGGCSGDEFWPLIIFNGYIFAIVPIVYLSLYISKEFKAKQLKNFIFNFLALSALFLIATTVLHKEELFDCDHNGKPCPWSNNSVSVVLK